MYLLLNSTMLILNISRIVSAKDTDVVVKAQQSANNFFVVFHYDVNSRANAFVNKFYNDQHKYIISNYYSNK